MFTYRTINSPAVKDVSNENYCIRINEKSGKQTTNWSTLISEIALRTNAAEIGKWRQSAHFWMWTWGRDLWIAQFSTAYTRLLMALKSIRALTITYPIYLKSSNRILNTFWEHRWRRDEFCRLYILNRLSNETSFYKRSETLYITLFHFIEVVIWWESKVCEIIFIFARRWKMYSNDRDGWIIFVVND